MRNLVVLLVSLCSSLSTQAETPQVDRIDIIEAGIYQANVERVEEVKGTINGRLDILSDINIIEITTTIPACVGTLFGIKFNVVGAPKYATVPLTMVLRLPPQGLRDPKAGETYFRSEYVSGGIISDNRYVGYSFDQDWEAVPGTWTFEIWYQDRKLAEQSFTVVSPERIGNKRSCGLCCPGW